MTREEAIERLTDYFEYEDGLSADKDTQEAYKMAIKALQAVAEIKEIINIANFSFGFIQEDVIKYKMICEVIEKMDGGKE